MGNFIDIGISISISISIGISISISTGTATATATGTNLSSTMMYETNATSPLNNKSQYDYRLLFNESSTNHPGFLTVQLIASSIAVILCCITILALILPLLEKRKRKRISSYNLYLVFLSIPDLVYNSFLIYLFSTYHIWIPLPLTDEEILQRANTVLPLVNHPFDLALFSACATANLYTNAIISYEILKLLRDSNKRKRSSPPSLIKATVQAGSAYTLGVIIFIIDFFAGDYLKTWPIWIIGPIYYGVSVGLPLLYLLWVCYIIYNEKLLYHNNRTGLRVLVKYFARIIIVYICIWFPSSILYSLQWSRSSQPGLIYFLACFFYAIQVWVSFGLSLTKPDVRTAVSYLLRFEYCRLWYRKNDDEEDEAQDGGRQIRHRRRRGQNTTRTGGFSGVSNVYSSGVVSCSDGGCSEVEQEAEEVEQEAEEVEQKAEEVEQKEENKTIHRREYKDATGITVLSSDSTQITKTYSRFHQIKNIRKNIVKWEQQLKEAVTDEEEELFRQSIVNQHIVLSRLTRLDSQDSFCGPTGDGTGTSRISTFIIPEIPNNNSYGKNSNSNSNSSKCVDNGANNAFQRLPLDTMSDDIDTFSIGLDDEGGIESNGNDYDGDACDIKIRLKE